MHLTVGPQSKLEGWLSKNNFPPNREGKSWAGFCATYAMDDQDDDKRYLIYHVHVDKANATLTLIHECLHLVRKIFQDRGIPFDEMNDEVIAYYQEYWVERMAPYVNR